MQELYKYFTKENIPFYDEQNLDELIPHLKDVCA